MWFAGTMGDGESCDEIRKGHGRTCSSEKLCIKTRSELEQVCQNLGFDLSGGIMEGEWSFRPLYYVQTKRCYGFGGSCNEYSCSSKDTTSSRPFTSRVCPCKKGNL